MNTRAYLSQIKRANPKHFKPQVLLIIVGQEQLDLRLDSVPSGIQIPWYQIGHVDAVTIFHRPEARETVSNLVSIQPWDACVQHQTGEDTSKSWAIYQCFFLNLHRRAPATISGELRYHLMPE